ncbi:bifunctional adenosylcobinamide kinase/adenosylcobinamide-phosphate guanylyltransferase [Sulfitobacter sp. JBTF-M27]|uniref:Bifunctional adenosylcobalamin biosynthesis protein n=1 Tax=Sulfitobacter sediminilitoris TaxID=2698830 RepID=A0A6P0CAD7_9RHOB|nr:bifunctional adenosylcobinamide kinase/adenosylcobinamide-phosphate guanylyltransferase [Sulfitobacter sediminilitoris]NEK22827.1 bifunctional adenosylcobinamide kinase/adenosylcobinamide-phosphate guanylyltransferase [Sulfitobacter sediminilitoris]
MLPRSTFVLGGAASGKSIWAEGLVESYNLPMVYLATGQVFDDEVEARVKIHKNRRNLRWQTVEEPFDLAPTLASLSDKQVVLIDCATMWLTNHLMNDANLEIEQARLLNALQTCAASWVIVSNEVGHGIVPDNAMARSFREAQGRLNITLAAQAELAVQVIAGLPQVLKGRLP